MCRILRGKRYGFTCTSSHLPISISFWNRAGRKRVVCRVVCLPPKIVDLESKGKKNPSACSPESLFCLVVVENVSRQGRRKEAMAWESSLCESGSQSSAVLLCDGFFLDFGGVKLHHSLWRFWPVIGSFLISCAFPVGSRLAQKMIRTD